MAKKIEELRAFQYAKISEFFDIKRKRKHSLHTLVNTLLQMIQTGCQWKNLHTVYPHGRAVNYYFEKWKRDGTISFPYTGTS